MSILWWKTAILVLAIATNIDHCLLCTCTEKKIKINLNDAAILYLEFPELHPKYVGKLKKM